MTKVVIDMTMSLDGFVAGPGDGKDYPLGKNNGMRIFDWYFSGKDQYRHELFRPEPGANLDQVKLMYKESGAFIFGRRTYDITNGWGGGVRLFDHLGGPVRLEKTSAADGPLATHLRYRVLKQ